LKDPVHSPSLRRDPPAAATGLHQQLFRYAEDLQELLASHATLEDRHKTVSAAFARTSRTLDVIGRLLDGAPDLYLVTDSHGRVKTCNRACGVLGPRDAILSSSLFDFAGTEARQGLQDVARARQADRRLPSPPLEAAGNDHRFASLSGDPLLLRLTSVEAATDDEHLELHWLFQDVTALREREFENRISSLVYENSADGILITDVGGNILAANPAMIRMTGYSASELVGRNPRFLASGMHDEEFYRQMWETLSSRGLWRSELFDRKKNGEILPVRCSVEAVRDERGEPVSYIAVYTDLSALQMSEQRLQYLAYHDALTGLPNRSLFKDRLAQAMSLARRGDYPLTVMFIDLDRFKPINDSLGHEAGDIVLREVGRRLEAVVRDVDTVARYGGDEFVILFPGLEDGATIMRIASDLDKGIGAPIEIAGHLYTIGASIGSASFPEDAESADQLIERADQAMYRAKQSGEHPVVRFAEIVPDENAEATLSIDQELRKALTRDQLHLQYQPQIEVRPEGRAVGLEVLLRWTHPVLGTIPPEVFIPVAERNGSIIAIGHWVIRSACRQLAMWHAAGHHELRMAINLSPRQLRDPSLIDVVRNTVAESGLHPADLEFEVSELDLLAEAESGFRHIHKLHDAGVRIAIDDFGRGYSSLAQLQSIPVDRLKIDPMFVKHLHGDHPARGMAGCIVAMARTLGLDVIAEGVELDAQLDILGRDGCAHVQGFLIAPPLDPSSVPAWLNNREATPPGGLGADRSIPTHRGETP
jgi:diguanylate cyclase (GGDEF)-like protein/PAS domain S-box-containing protein